METEFKEGEKVHYAPKFGDRENGIIKSVNNVYAYVVYKCGNDWNNYMNYTGARTYLDDLKHGWV